MKIPFVILFTAGWLPLLAAAAPPPETPQAIPLDQLRAAAEKQSTNNGSGITPTAAGAKLTARMQDLEAEATADGLWLTSTADENAGRPNRFRVRGMAMGRDAAVPIRLGGIGIVRSTPDRADFVRPELSEEYSVSTDGVRQDFLVPERPAGAGEMTVELEITGAHAEAADYGAKLTVAEGGRELAYSRLKVTDASGRELAARMVVAAADRLRVFVDDLDAAYPVRIDPTFSDADWVSMGQTPGVQGGGCFG